MTIQDNTDTPRHPAFNSKKVTAHTALVPTGKDASRLAGVDAELYEIVAKATLALFLPAQIYDETTVVVDLASEKWGARGRGIIDAGWTALYPNSGADKEQQSIPVMHPRDAVDCISAQVLSKKTAPPAKLTEGALIDAMSHIHRYVTDPAARSRLKETSGLGTEATRARIIETLFARGWIERRGKAVVSTDAGRAVVATLPADLTDPVTTAIWEDALAEIAAGKGDAGEFTARIAEHIRASLAQVPPPAPRAHSDAPTAECPVCGRTARRLESRKKPGVFFWSCENREHPLLADDASKPGAPFADRKKTATAPAKKKRARKRA